MNLMKLIATVFLSAIVGVAVAFICLLKFAMLVVATLMGRRS